MKKQYKYSTIRERIYDPHMGKYTTYGIKVTSNNSAFASEFISDVTLSKKKLSGLVRKCNSLQLHPVHLRDVIDDFLAK